MAGRAVTASVCSAYISLGLYTSKEEKEPETRRSFVIGSGGSTLLCPPSLLLLLLLLLATVFSSGSFLYVYISRRESATASERDEFVSVSTPT
jgi:hypothetical protein